MQVPVIMIPDAGARAELFGEAWCGPILAEGYRIVRLDNRDVGRSEWINFDQAPYTLDTMAEDIIALMEALHISTAHLIGNSMGGMIAQLVAIRAPERVMTVVLAHLGAHRSSHPATRGSNQ